MILIPAALDAVAIDAAADAVSSTPGLPPDDSPARAAVYARAMAAAYAAIAEGLDAGDMPDRVSTAAYAAARRAALYHAAANAALENPDFD